MSNESLLLLDDDMFVRTTLSDSLSSRGYLVSTFEKVSDAVNHARKEKIDLAVLDLDLGPGPNGIDAAIALRRLLPRIGLIFLTSYSDPRFISANGLDLPIGSRYLIKSRLNDISELESLIRQTIQWPLKTNRKPPKSEVKLTTNQIEILRMIASGKSTSQIAIELNVTEKSIESVISRINQSLGNISSLENKRVSLTNFYYRLIGKI